MQTVQGVAVARTCAEFSAWCRSFRAGGRTLGLVPTMGALHQGHATLMRMAAQHADGVAVSIFVNPKQFGPAEDFGRYPRQFEGDCALCAAAGVAVVFAPAVEELYPAGFQTRVEVEQLQARWEGQSRPGHFAGVATVGIKLLNLALADVAVFGEKDWQQLAIVARMARDLGHPTRILGAPIARDPDGLAQSSRNAYLSADERSRARAISAGLRAVARAAADGQRATAPLVAQLRAHIEAAGGRIDYATIVDAATLEHLDCLDRPARALVAAWFGAPKLLDNWALGPSDSADAGNMR
ncbi:MAG: pantoate--beta-alanine ligase [Deltaproteobacteria bacterium]|nr:pantoate--beta-alanine ligase [Deltaproteobacteria bacterium]